MPRNELTQARGALTQARGTLTQARGTLTQARGEFVALPPDPTGPDPAPSGTIYQQITAEATRLRTDAGGHPLPLASTWNCGHNFAGNTTQGIYPAWQMARIAEGKHFLPTLQWPGFDDSGQFSPAGYYDALDACVANVLPFCFVASQWESWFAFAPIYGESITTNPNVFDQTSGSPVQSADPLGPLVRWSDVTAHYNSEPPLLAGMQADYPNPPLILFISNNEYGKHRWPDALSSQRYVTAHGTGQTEAFNQALYVDGHEARYAAMVIAMKAGFAAQGWRDAACCIGYEAVGTMEFKEGPIWHYFTQAKPGQITMWHRCWDGGTPSYYIFADNGMTDYFVYCPQTRCQNLVFQNEFAYAENPNWWFELSTWDGHQPGGSVSPPLRDTRAWLASLGQTYTPARYAGMVKFGMWMLRPRVVREYRNANDPMANIENYILAVMAAVDQVWANPIFVSFWRDSELVVNTAHTHAYTSGDGGSLHDWDSAERRYQLSNNLDPSPWPTTGGDPGAAFFIEIPVFAMARVRGDAPNREWLVYAHSPKQDRTAVQITVPGWTGTNPITVNVDIVGNYYLCSENGGSVVEVT